MPAEEYRVVAIQAPSLPRKVDLWQRKGAAVCHYSTFLGGRRPSGSLPLPQVQFPQQPANAGVPSHCHRSAFLGCPPTDWVGGVGSPGLFEPLSWLRRSPRARRPGPTPPAATPPSPAACRPQYKDAWREQCECRLPDPSRRRIGRPGARMGHGRDAWRGGYARGADGTTWDPGAHMGWGHARGRVLRDPEARTNLGRGALRDLGARTDSGGPERCTPRGD